MDTHIRFLMIGGFLGAGKTTAVARLARHYLAEGERVGLVTNDQASDLVDTHSLRAQGFQVGEVAGACFCCRFDSLLETLTSLEQDQVPSVILAEPVGSCTDVMSTVLKPLRQMYGDRYHVAPLVVLLKPEHGRKILRREKHAGFSPKAAYIFLKQLEEADVVAINKIDKLATPEREELVELVQSQFPEKHVLAVSARNGDGFSELIQRLQAPTPTRTRPIQVDYNIYAEGEAELGWLNCRISVAPGSRSFPLDQFVLDSVQTLGAHLKTLEAEAAHVKAIGQYEQAVAVANLVATSEETELSQASHAMVPQLQMILNARVAAAPDDLQMTVDRAMAEIGRRYQLQLTVDRSNCFRPGRPTPTYRLDIEL